jgi:hypothetical protein
MLVTWPYVTLASSGRAPPKGVAEGGRGSKGNETNVRFANAVKRLRREAANDCIFMTAQAHSWCSTTGCAWHVPVLHEEQKRNGFLGFSERQVWHKKQDCVGAM